MPDGHDQPRLRVQPQVKCYWMASRKGNLESRSHPATIARVIKWRKPIQSYKLLYFTQISFNPLLNHAEIYLKKCEANGARSSIATLFENKHLQTAATRSRPATRLEPPLIDILFACLLGCISLPAACPPTQLFLIWPYHNIRAPFIMNICSAVASPSHAWAFKSL